MDLRGNSVGPVGCRALSALLAPGRGLVGLRSLVLNGNPVGAEGAAGIAAALTAGAPLESLDLGNCELPINAIIDLAAAAANAPSLQSLSLENPRLFGVDEDVARHLSVTLRVNRTLRTLKLGKCRVRDAGAALLAEALAANRTLRELDLRCNEIGVAGAEALALALLTPDCSLAVLGLASNRVADLGAHALSIALSANTSLEVWVSPPPPAAPCAGSPPLVVTTHRRPLNSPSLPCTL